MFDLTAQEKKVLIALGAFAVLGLAVLAYRAYFARPELTVASKRQAGVNYEAAIKQNSAVNINTADAERIATLPDIGPKTARDIADYRTAHGQFLLKEDLKKVGGIGPKTFEKIKDLIVLE